MLFSSKLKYLRTKSNLTQKDMANILGIGDRQYQRYESDNVDPPLSNVIKISNYFNVSLDYLLGRTDDVSDAPLTNEQINRVDIEKKIDEIFDDLSEESKKEALKYAEFLLRKQQEDENKNMKDK